MELTTQTAPLDASNNILAIGNGISGFVTYTYDEVGNPNVQRSSGAVATYAFDALDRVTTLMRSEFGSMVATLAYDAVGNRTWSGDFDGVVSEYDAAGQATKTITNGIVQTHSYDANGNLVNVFNALYGQNPTTITYDFENRNRTEPNPGAGLGVITSIYDVDGYKVRTIGQNFGARQVVWDESEYLFESDPNGDREYVSVEGELFALKNANPLTVLVRDALGSVFAAERGGVNIGSASYRLYGHRISSTGVLANDEVMFQWVGAYGNRYEGRTWMTHYVRMRDYSMYDGLWTSRDPLWPGEDGWDLEPRSILRFPDFFGLKPVSWSRRINPHTNPGLCKVFPQLCDWSAPKPQPHPFGSPPPRPTWYPKGLPWPPPSSGKSPGQPNQNFVHPYSPTTFGYGLCCGLGRKCGCKGTLSGEPPIDCLDRACARHDVCLGTWAIALDPVNMHHCNRLYVEELSKCDCSEYWTPQKQSDCQQAKFNMMTLWGAIGASAGVLPGSVVWGSIPVGIGTGINAPFPALEPIALGKCFTHPCS